MKNIFTDHPNSIGESYIEHFLFAFKFGAKLVLAGLACMTHALLPFFFKKTASDLVIETTRDFIERMPTLEERIICIHECIEKKKSANGFDN